MEARFSRPGVRWVFLAGVFAVAGALAFSGGRIALANHYAARETSEGLARASHLEPGNAEHWYFLGRYWQYNFDQPDLPLAISYYQRALALDPRDTLREMSRCSSACQLLTDFHGPGQLRVALQGNRVSAEGCVGTMPTEGARSIA